MIPQPSISEVRKAVFLLPAWQMLTGVIVGIVFYFIAGANAAVAGVFGASISCAGSLVFAFIIFGLGKQSAENITRLMFRAEAFKIMTITVMFYLAFAKLGLPFLPVIIGFIVSLMVFFIALLTVFR